MADLGHLEKMGRELKCPICLSLLNSAVSLVCNHIFCNLCIIKSMKSASDCPVCKAPFCRREVRPAPHMDNLVNIFKSMEVAAGFTIFTTQVQASEKASGEKNGPTETPVISQGKQSERKSSRRKAKESWKSDVETSDFQQLNMPSFPAKKRVHVTPYSVSETPLGPSKISKLTNPLTEAEENGVLDENKKQTIYEMDNPSLSPFFWLREENADDGNVSDKPSSQQTTNTPPPYNAPCFSDIKDSDDDLHTKTTPTSKSYLGGAGAFDSEMFEWTQRACSPELCLTPMKKQAGERQRLDGIQEKECPSRTGVASRNDVRRGSLRTKRRPKNKKRKMSVKELVSRTSKSDLLEIPSEVPTDTCDLDKSSSKQDKRDKEKLPSSGRSSKSCKKRTYPYLVNSFKEPIHPATIAEASEEVYTIPKEQNPEKETAKVIRACRKTKATARQGLIAKVIGEAPKITASESELQARECEKIDVSFLGFASKSNENDNGIGRGKVKESKEIPSQRKSKRKTRTDGDEKPLAVEVARNEKPKIEEMNPQETEISALKSAKKTKETLSLSGRHILRKCKNNDPQIQCVFCQSRNDTKDSGEMIHYFNGTLVAADYNGGANLIHAHKNCTEWAPDVYFEDDLAMNLATELARSKRIKCSCCGIKGAALGCFEKSCRKSFHYTCARLIPECRWDNEYFVMLCPLHSSSKLPNETSQPQRKRRKQATTKGELHVSSVQKPDQDTGRAWRWPAGSPGKLVLCCSGLTNEEKDLISEFTKLTGVHISEKWSPTVTHVIASANENGACRRTLKFLMGILTGKWILSIDWIRACMKAMEPINEENFEIRLDIHGVCDGPRLGRMMAAKKQTKLFSSFRFYFSGDFSPSYKGYLHDLVTAAGGIVLQRKPISRDQERLLNETSTCTTFIVYSLELPEKQKSTNDPAFFGNRKVEAQTLADASGAKVVTNTWILDSIAGCKLQVPT